MYSQVKILDKDRDFDRIFWKDSPDKQIQVFFLNHVWYGTPVVLNLATKILNQLPIDVGLNFPEAKVLVLRDFYINNVLSGFENSQEGGSEFKKMHKK